jgi:hypothetical protein
MSLQQTPSCDVLRLYINFIHYMQMVCSGAELNIFLKDLHKLPFSGNIRPRVEAKQ